MKYNQSLIFFCIFSISAMIVLALQSPKTRLYLYEPSTKFVTLKPSELEGVIGTECNALTKWDYKLSNKIVISSVESISKDDSSKWKFVVNSITTKTNLQIKVILPENASEELRLHEKGHVAICKKIYQQSLDNIPSIVDSVFKEEYQVEDVSFAKAQAKALDHFNGLIVQKYDAITNKLASKVSKRYDKLSGSSKLGSSELIDSALKHYEIPQSNTLERQTASF